MREIKSGEEQERMSTTELTPIEMLYGRGARIINGILFLEPRKEDKYRDVKPTDPQF